MNICIQCLLYIVYIVYYVEVNTKPNFYATEPWKERVKNFSSRSENLPLHSAE